MARRQIFTHDRKIKVSRIYLKVLSVSRPSPNSVLYIEYGKAVEYYAAGIRLNSSCTLYTVFDIIVLCTIYKLFIQRLFKQEL